MATRERLRRLIDLKTPTGRAFEKCSAAVIVGSLIAFTLSTLPGGSQSLRRWLAAIELASVLLFTTEYLVRLYAAEDRRAYAFSFFGLVDLIAIAPFWLSFAIDLRAVRVLRLLRLFRLAKLVRLSRAIDRYGRAIRIASAELILFGSAALIVLYLAAVGIWFCECEAQPDAFASIPHALWWSVITLTTVGYGDVYPITLGGRIWTTVVLAVGLGFVAVPSGIIASALSEARQSEVKSHQQD